ncbi:hypothetical protein BX666DRAFT_537031 [Dichotomocladium elegans]|nr:hypothetical protein BX666DRAFT_537031 [Dichotomocladium elegans]
MEVFLNCPHPLTSIPQRTSISCAPPPSLSHYLRLSSMCFVRLKRHRRTLPLVLSHQTLSLGYYCPPFSSTSFGVNIRSRSPTPALPASGRPHLRVDLGQVIACTVLAIWQAHWRFVYHNERFWQNAVTACATLPIHRLDAEAKVNTA